MSVIPSIVRHIGNSLLAVVSLKFRSPLRLICACITVLSLISIASCTFLVKAQSSQSPDEALKKEILKLEIDAMNYAWKESFDGAITVQRSILDRLESMHDPVQKDSRKIDTLFSIGLLHYLKGEYQKSADLYSQALAIDKARTKANISTWVSSEGRWLVWLALTEQALGHGRTASGYFQLAEKSRSEELWQWVTHLESSGYDYRRSVFESSRAMSEILVAANIGFAGNDPVATRTALTGVLHWKGRDADSFGVLKQAIRFTKPELAPLLNEYLATRTKLSNLKYALRTESGEDKTLVKKYENALKLLQSQLEDKTLLNTVSGEPETFEEIQQSIPPNAALIEYVLYKPIVFVNNRPQFGPQRYAAYVIKDRGDPIVSDLGDASTLDRLIAELLNLLRDRFAVEEVRAKAAYVFSQAFSPLMNKLGGTRSIFVSPEGALNLVPFGALVGNDGKYLVEDYSFKYLLSGRDMLWLRPRARTGSFSPRARVHQWSMDWDWKSRQSPVIFGYPDFNSDLSSLSIFPARPCEPATLSARVALALANEAATSASPSSRANASASPAKSSDAAPNTGNRTVPGTSLDVDYGKLRFERRGIDQTRQEVEDICEYLPGGVIYSSSSAAEPVLKRVTGPSVIHIATHGFFFDDKTNPSTRSDNLWAELQFGSGPPQQMEDDPNLRSGLALAGANERHGGDNEDGILTASELSDVDLVGTRLAVLSACDTGLGEMRDGSLVSGLRRALVIAGSESQVISLWAVNDGATNMLMKNYYRHLWEGQGRGEALRQAQLDLLRGAPELRAPFYWAGFINSGAWTSLSLILPDKP